MPRLLTLSLLTLTFLSGLAIAHANRLAPERPQYGKEKEPKPNPRPNPGPRDGNEE